MPNSFWNNEAWFLFVLFAILKEVLLFCILVSVTTRGSELNIILLKFHH